MSVSARALASFGYPADLLAEFAVDFQAVFPFDEFAEESPHAAKAEMAIASTRKVDILRISSFISLHVEITISDDCFKTETT